MGKKNKNLDFLKFNLGREINFFVLYIYFTILNFSRISQTRTYTRNVGVNMYTNIKNLTWDPDGQLAAVEAQEPWGFKYDANGNMLSLTYR